MAIDETPNKSTIPFFKKKSEITREIIKAVGLGGSMEVKSGQPDFVVVDQATGRISISETKVYFPSQGVFPVPGEKAGITGSGFDAPGTDRSDSQPPAGIALLLSQTDHEADMAQAIGDDRRCAILEKTRRFLSRLESRARSLNETATQLHRTLPQHSVPGEEPVSVEQLENTLDSFVIQLEKLLPAASRRNPEMRFTVDWTHDGGQGSWEIAGKEPVSIQLLLKDCAGIEGRVPDASSGAVARIIVDALRSGEIALPRLRQVGVTTTLPRLRQVGASTTHSTYQLVPRGVIVPENEAEELNIGHVRIEAEAAAADPAKAAIKDEEQFLSMFFGDPR